MMYVPRLPPRTKAGAPVQRISIILLCRAKESMSGSQTKINQTFFWGNTTTPIPSPAPFVDPIATPAPAPTPAPVTAPTPADYLL